LEEEKNKILLVTYVSPSNELANKNMQITVAFNSKQKDIVNSIADVLNSSVKFLKFPILLGDL
jgi:hypothetical protein